MKKILLTVLIVALAAGTASAGEIGSIIGIDMLVGAFGGAAIGAVASVPAFLEGNGLQPEVFVVGVGWGALIGGGIGFCYSIYDIIYHVQKKQGVIKPQEKKAYLGDDLYIDFDTKYEIGMTLCKNF